MQLFIAQTLDGFIAGPGGSLEHLVPFEGQDYGYDAFLAGVEAVVLGRHTFDLIVPRHGWTYPPALPGVVMTSRPLPQDMPPQVTTATDPMAVAHRFPRGFIDGGAETIRRFLDLGLVTEARLFTLPIRIGAGVPLFAAPPARPETWRLLAARSHPCGTVASHFVLG